MALLHMCTLGDVKKFLGQILGWNDQNVQKNEQVFY